MSHTPGPWHRNIRAGGKYPTIFAGRNTHVAHVVGHGTLPADEIEANIDLIAAAPDLLAALEAIKVWGRSRDGSPEADETALREIVEITRAAIAKARGQA